MADIVFSRIVPCGSLFSIKVCSAVPILKLHKYKMLTKRNDIIPITFIGGSGGRFLGAFLYHAREGHNNWNFTEHGSAVQCMQDRYPLVAKGTMWDTIGHITSLNSIPISLTVKYIPCHISDVTLLLNYFDRVIKIHVDQVDWQEVGQQLSLKWRVDEQRRPPRNLYFFIPNIIQESISSPQLLNINWKDLIYQDPKEFIRRLSSFTSLDESRFPLDQLLIWRELTIKNLVLPTGIEPA